MCGRAKEEKGQLITTPHLHGFCLSCGQDKTSFIGSSSRHEACGQDSDLPATSPPRATTSGYSNNHGINRLEFVLSAAMALLMEHQFRQMPADRQVETRPFLEAVSYLPPFFDCLGSTIFAPIKADVSGNIIKIKAVYDSNPARFKTLQQILEAEKEMHGAEWPKAGATLALMWLKRGLRFIQVFLQSIVDGEKDESNPNLIRVNVTKAYEIALKRYHGWLVQQLFKAALYAAPYKSDFLKALSKGREVKEEECLEKIRKFLVNFTATVDTIYEMYNKMNADLDYTV